MGRSIRIIVLSLAVFIIVANLAFFTLSQSNFLGYDWVAINIYNPNSINVNYEYRGFAYFFEYLSTFPGLNNTVQTWNYVAALVSGQFAPTDWSVVNAILGVLFLLWSPVQLIITFVIDILNDVLWILFFFIPKHWFA